MNTSENRKISKVFLLLFGSIILLGSLLIFSDEEQDECRIVSLSDESLQRYISRPSSEIIWSARFQPVFIRVGGTPIAQNEAGFVFAWRACNAIYLLDYLDGSVVWVINDVYDPNHITVDNNRGIGYVSGRDYITRINVDSGITIDQYFSDVLDKNVHPVSILSNGGLLVDAFGLRYFYADSQTLSDEINVPENTFFYDGSVAIFSDGMKVIAKQNSTGRVLWEKEFDRATHQGNVPVVSSTDMGTSVLLVVQDPRPVSVGSIVLLIDKLSGDVQWEVAINEKISDFTLNNQEIYLLLQTGSVEALERSNGESIMNLKLTQAQLSNQSQIVVHEETLGVFLEQDYVFVTLDLNALKENR